MKTKFIYIFLCFILFACQENQTSSASSTKSNEDKYQALTAAIEANPYNAEAIYNRANAYYINNRIGKAKDDLDQSIEVDSLYLPSLKLRAKISFEENRFQAALQDLNTCINKDPEDEETHIIIARIYLFIMKHQEAINHVNIALRINKFNAESYFLKGYCYKEATDTTRAMSAFQTAIEQDPNHFKSYMQMALMAYNQNNDLCVEYYNQAIRIDPMSQEAVYGKAFYYQEKQQYDASIATYRNLLKLNNQNEKAYYNLGYVYLMMDSLDQSYKHFNAACRMAPQYANAYYNRAYVSELLGKYQDAMNDYRQAMSLNPEHTSANEGLERVKKTIKDT